MTRCSATIPAARLSAWRGLGLLGQVTGKAICSLIRKTTAWHAPRDTCLENPLHNTQHPQQTRSPRISEQVTAEIQNEALEYP